MCVCGLGMCAQPPHGTCGNQSMTCVGQFSFLTMWVLGDSGPWDKTQAVEHGGKHFHPLS